MAVPLLPVVDPTNLVGTINDWVKNYLNPYLSAGGSGVGGVLSVTRTLSSAELKALHTTPITIIKAPGTNKVISIRNFYYIYLYGTTQYTDSGDTSLYYGTPSNTALAVDAGILGFLLENTENSYAAGTATAGLAGQGTFSNPFQGVSSLFVNQPIVAGNDEGSLTVGDGTVKIVIYYIINDVSP